MAGAVLGQHLLAVAGNDGERDPGLGEARLQRLRHFGPGRSVAHVDGDGETVAEAGLRQQRLGSGGIVAERLIVDGAEIALRLEGLMNDARAAEDGALDAVVIDQPLDRGDHFGAAQIGVLLIEREIGDEALDAVVDADGGVAGDGVELILVEVAGIVDVAAQQHQPLRRRLLDVADEDVAVGRRAAPIVRVGLEHIALGRAPQAEPIGAGAGGMGGEPAIAEIALLLMRQHCAPLDDAADRRAQTEIDEARREHPLGLDDQRVVVGRAQPRPDIVLGQAELAQHEGRRLVEQHGTLQREGGVARRHRRAAGETRLVAQLEREDASAGIDAPRRGQARRGCSWGRADRLR